MAKVVLGAYMVRYPLGGMLSGFLQWLLAVERLGHEAWLVEKAGWSGSCYDPVRDVMDDDCSQGIRTIHALLGRYGLAHRWCYVDAAGNYHGAPRSHIESVFAETAAFIDLGTHGSWLEEAATARVRVLVDGEPAWTQMKMAERLDDGQEVAEYDAYYTV